MIKIVKEYCKSYMLPKCDITFYIDNEVEDKHTTLTLSTLDTLNKLYK